MELLRESQFRRVIGRLELVDHREKLGRVNLVGRVLAVSLRIGLEHETCLNVVSASRRACDMWRHLRRTRRIDGEGQVKDSEREHESLESYAPTSAGRDNDRSSPDEDGRLASFEREDQNLRARSNVFF